MIIIWRLHLIEINKKTQSLKNKIIIIQKIRIKIDFILTIFKLKIIQD